MHARRLHGLQQGDRAAHVVFVVAQWLGHGFAHGLECGEVDHLADGVLGKQPVQRGAVAHIAFHAQWAPARDAFHAG